MSADWIKMRCDLQTHPKIVRILSAICPQSVRNLSEVRQEKFRIVGALHAVWSMFDMHTLDGILRGYTPELMDDAIGLPGIARAMIEVGWLEYDGAQTLVMPEFEAHNGKGAKRRAEDAKRKKSERANGSENRPQNVRKMSEKIWTKSGLEKEKEKELTTKSKTKAARTAQTLPAVAVADFRQRLADQGIPDAVVSDWLTLRRVKRAPVTDTALRGIEREAAKAGVSLGAALAMCCERGWTGFKAEWVRNGTGAPAPASRDAGRAAAARAFMPKTEKASNDTGIIDITPPASGFLGR